MVCVTCDIKKNIIISKKLILFVIICPIQRLSNKFIVIFIFVY